MRLQVVSKRFTWIYLLLAYRQKQLPKPFIKDISLLYFSDFVFSIQLLSVTQPLQPKKRWKLSLLDVVQLLAPTKTTESLSSSLKTLKFDLWRGYVKAAVAQLHSRFYKQRPISEKTNLRLTNALQGTAGLEVLSQSARGQTLNRALAWLRIVFGYARHRH